MSDLANEIARARENSLPCERCKKLVQRNFRFCTTCGAFNEDFDDALRPDILYNPLACVNGHGDPIPDQEASNEPLWCGWCGGLLYRSMYKDEEPLLLESSAE